MPRIRLFFPLILIGSISVLAQVSTPHRHHKPRAKR